MLFSFRIVRAHIRNILAFSSISTHWRWRVSSLFFHNDWRIRIYMWLKCHLSKHLKFIWHFLKMSFLVKLILQYFSLVKQSLWRLQNFYFSLSWSQYSPEVNWMEWIMMIFENQLFLNWYHLNTFWTVIIWKIHLFFSFLITFWLNTLTDRELF